MPFKYRTVDIDRVCETTSANASAEASVPIRPCVGRCGFNLSLPAFATLRFLEPVHKSLWNLPRHFYQWSSLHLYIDTFSHRNNLAWYHVPRAAGSSFGKLWTVRALESMSAAAESVASFQKFYAYPKHRENSEVGKHGKQAMSRGLGMLGAQCCR